MTKKKVVVGGAEAPVKPEKPAKVTKAKGFSVTDSNGKNMPHSYKTREEAEEAAKVYGGKVVEA